MALPARASRRRSLPLRLITLEDRTTPVIKFTDWTVGAHPFGWLGGEHVERQDLPPSGFAANPNGYLTGPQSGHRDALALQNLREYAGVLNIPAADAQAKLVTRTDSYADQVGTLQHVYLRQTVNGLPVLNSSVGVHYAADGRLLTINGGFFPGLAALDGSAAEVAVRAEVAAVEAAYQLGYEVTAPPLVVSAAAGADRVTVLEVPEASDRPVTARLAYVFSAAAKTARPVWHFDLRTPDGENWYDVGVDTKTGEVLFSSNWGDHFGTYNSLALPNESPVDPTPGGKRTYEVNPHDAKWSPFGWHDTNGKAGNEFADTRGNNVSAQLDLAATNPTIATPTAGGNRPAGGTFNVYDNPYSLALEPTVASQRDALVTNLFYANNMLHDIHAAYGFTEAAGNFQFTNYSGQGAGNDQVHADAQDGIGTNNANFFTPPDGTPGRMQMFRFTLSTPGTDSDLENGIVAHELGHGVSNRLTGGPANSNALNAAQSGAMGEGWSDFHALMVTQVAADGPNTPRGMGNWVLGQDPVTGGGIRAPEFGVPGGKPYSFDLAVNTMNFAEYGTVFNVAFDGPHAGGARWASALWDLNWLLIAKYGFDADLTTGYDPATAAGRAGNKLTMRLVMDGLKLQPANPSVIQARDAILQADAALTGGVNRREIWAAFARRSLGFGSSTTGATQTSALVTTKNMPAEANNPGVIAVTPPGRSGTPPGRISLTFSEAMDPASLAAADLLSFTGPGGVDLLPNVTGFAWSAGNTVLAVDFTPAPGTSQGNYALTLGPTVLSADTGSQLDQDLDGAAGEAAEDKFTAFFQYDQTQLAVVDWTPVTGGIADTKLAAIDVRFNEPVDPASVSAGDLQVSQNGVVTGASVVGDGTTVRFSVAGLQPGRVFLQVKQAGVTDKYGFGTLTGRSDFLIPGAIATAALPVPLAAQGPLGSLSYQSATPGTGTLANAVDLAQFTVSLDAGQTLNVVVDGVTTLAPRVAVVAPGGAVLGSATSNGAGQPVTLAGLSAAAPGVYTIQVTSAQNTTGGFSVRAQLNTQPEAEAPGAAANNTPAAAQPLAGFYPTAGGGLVATVAGKSDGVAPFVLPEVEPNDTAAAATAAGGSFTPTPAGETYLLPITGALTGGDNDFYRIGALDAGDVITIDTYGSSSAAGVGLTLFDSFLELRNAAGIIVAQDDDGGPAGFQSQIFKFTIPANDTYFVNVRGFGATDTGSYKAGVYLQNKGGSPAPLTGGAFPADTEDNGSVAAAVNAASAWRRTGFTSAASGAVATTADKDLFAYTFQAGDLVNVRVNGVTPLRPQVALLSAAGTTLYLDDGFSNGGASLASWLPALLVPTTGTYFVQVRSAGGTGGYSLGVDLATATAPSPLAPPGPTLYDHYSVTLAAGDLLSAGLRQTAGTTAQFDVLNPAGAVVASSAAKAGGASYSAALNGYAAPAAGTYQVRVQDTVPNPYTLTVGANAVLDVEPNTAAPQPADGARVAVGAVVADTDSYSFAAADGSSFVLRVTTPGSGPGEFRNGLIPALTLLDPLGNPVAAVGTGAPNVRLDYTVPAGAGGTYTAVVSSLGDTSGEYVLSLPGAVNQAPAGVTAGGPYSVPEGKGVSFAAAAFDADGDPLTFEWDVNADGVYGDLTGPAPSLTWAELEALGLGDGPFLRPVRVRASDGPAATVSKAAELNIVNVAPTGALDPVTVNEAAAATFALTGAADPSAADAAAGFKYAFDFDADGTWDAGTGTYAGGVGATVTAPASYFPDGPAGFPFRARVLDKDGGFTDYTSKVTVQNVAPTATVVNGGAVTEGATGLVRFTAPTDVSAEDKVNGFRFAYDYDNDGTFDDGDGTYAGSLLATARTVPAKYLADGPGARTVRLRVIDKDNGATDYTTVIGVTNVAPTAKLAAGPPVGEGKDGTVAFTAPADKSPVDTAAGFRYAYDFDNDGTFDLGDGTYAGSGAAAAVPVPAKYLPGSGSFTVRGRILDKDGGSTDYTSTVAVTNVAPTAVIATGLTTPEGTGVTFGLSGAFDPSPADTAAGFRYAFDFDNDGLWDLGDGTYAGSKADPTATAAGKYFPDNGSRTLRARILDQDGGFTDYSTAVAVANVAPTAKVANSGPIDEGKGVTVTLSGASDPSPDDTRLGFRYAVRFAGSAAWLTGDGTYAGGKASPVAVLPADLFPDGAATYDLVARILDDDGGFTDYPTTVTVRNVAPTATLGGTLAVTEGAAGGVAFSAPVDPSAADTKAGFRYAFDFDDDGTFEVGTGTYAGGVPDPAAVVPAKYFADGGPGVVRTVRGRILDRDGGSTDYTLAVSVQNAPPTAGVTNGGAVAEGTPGSVALVGAADPAAADAAALRFAFDFDNDGAFDLGDGTYAGSVADATAAVPAQYLDSGPGNRLVRVRVIDKDGGFSQYQTLIPVTNTAPTATFFNPGAVAEGGTAVATFAGPLDPSAGDTAAGFRYAYDFDNDGTFDLGDGTYAGSVADAAPAVPARFLADGPGTFTVRGRILDRDGGSTDYLTAIAVTNVAPTAKLASGGAVVEGGLVSVSFTTPADPSAGDTAAGFRYAYDFDNDGTFDLGDGTYAGGVGASAEVPAEFLADGPGTRTVRGRVVDRDGGFADLLTTVNVSNAAPTATPVFGPAVTIGTASTLALTDATDPSAADVAAGLTYSFDFDGDGLFEQTGPAPGAAFVYPRPGSYPVSLRVTDRDGGATTYAGVLAVANAAPTAGFAAAGAVPEGTAATVRFAGAAHPSPATTAAGFRYAYDLDGDGRFDLGDGTYAGSVTSPEVTLPAALTADAGTRTVRGRVVEVNGLSADYTAAVTVTNVAPTAKVLPPAGGSGGVILVGDPVTVGVTQATDPSAGDRRGLTYSFDFDGDGGFEVTGSATPTAAYAYPAAGGYTAVVRVADPKGGFTDYPVPVTVSGTDPVPVAVPNYYAVGSDVGGGAARLFDDTAVEVYSGRPFGADFTGGVRVATADVTGDGVPDLIAGTGPGAVTRVMVIDGRTREPVLDVQPFEDRFTGGVYVAGGDTDGDGKAEVVVTPDQGGGPVVAAYAAGGRQVARFFGIEDEAFRGGARAALADVTGDGKADLMVAAGFGGGPRLAGYDGPSLAADRPVKLWGDFFVFEQTLRNGVYVAAGDLNRDGHAELIVGGGPGGGPRVMAMDGKGLLEGRQQAVADYFAGDPENRDGVRVGVADLDLDGDADVLTSSGRPGMDGFRVRGYRAGELVQGVVAERYLLDPFPGERGGVFVG